MLSLSAHRLLAARHSRPNRMVTEDSEVQSLARNARRVAVLGCKTEKQASQPAFFVPQYLQRAGVDVVPVPVFYPDVTEILGEQVYRRVADIPGPYDILVMFRKPSDLMPHLPDILSAPNRPPCVWLQSGITNPEFEAALLDAGVLVVADRCIKVEHQIATSRQSHL